MLTPEATPQRAGMSVTGVRPRATFDIGVVAWYRVFARAGLPFGDDQRGR
jgi:hypothetical protein